MNQYTEDGRDLRAEVAPYLSNEELLWVGRPYTSRTYRPNGVLLVFMFIWTAFAVFWTVTAASAGGFFAIFGLPFVCIGVYMLYRICWGEKKRYAVTVYAVTDRRILIIYPDRKRGMSSTEYVLSNLQTLVLEEVEGNVGTIRFRHGMAYIRTGYGSRRTGTAEPAIDDAFYAIDDVHTVYHLISERMGK